jgi:two-component system, LytTR family, sensor kinase
MPTSTIWQIYGFGVGATLSALLAAVVYRSPGSCRWARFGFAACALIVNVVCIAKHAAILGGVPAASDLVRKIWSVGPLAAALWPICILLGWREQANVRRVGPVARCLLPLSVASAIWIVTGSLVSAWAPVLSSRVPVWKPFLDHEFVVDVTVFNGLFATVAGAIFLLPGRLERRRDRVAVAFMIGGLSLAAASTALYKTGNLSDAWTHGLQASRLQFIGLTVMGGLLYFSQFRSADVFARRALHVLLGAGVAIVAATVISGPCRIVADHTSNPTGVLFLFSAIVISLCILLRSQVTRAIEFLIQYWIFGAREIPDILLGFKDQLGEVETEAQVLDEAKRVIHNTLGLQQAQLMPAPMASDADGFQGISVPVVVSGRQIVFHLVFQEGVRHLVTAEWEVLSQIAAACGERLDELRRQEERVARLRHESQLAQQLIQAELRALRAQINPHFLFNSLNTIASLIVSDPRKAEAMTVRLAHIFHYVLTHADRPLAPLEEEIGFLRTYLSIEQVRFGERLAVEFDLDPDTSGAVVPSLILQPLVENAIKHGIAPKVGRSTLTVRARRDHARLLLSVLDDGVGLRARGPSTGENSFGVGLRNIRERLQTMYGRDAELSLQAQTGGGSIAAIELPLSE